MNTANYRIARICGRVHSNGNLVFSSDGNTVYSPVGNRVSAINLTNQTNNVLQFQNKQNISHIALSPNGMLMISMDESGQTIFYNIQRRVILHRMTFKHKCHGITFSPNGSYFAITAGRGFQIWRTPTTRTGFAPLDMFHNYSGFGDDVVAMSWSSDSQSIVASSQDMTCRIYHDIFNKNQMTVLSGHRDFVINAYFFNSDSAILSISRDGVIYLWKQSQNDTRTDSDHFRWQLYHKHMIWSDETLAFGTGTIVTCSSLSTLPSSMTSSTGFRYVILGLSSGVIFVYLLDSSIDTTLTETATSSSNSTSNGLALLTHIKASSTAITSTDYNYSNHLIAIGTAQEHSVTVYDWRMEMIVLKQSGHMMSNTGSTSDENIADSMVVSLSPSGSMICSGSATGIVKVWDVCNGLCLSTFNCHSAPVTDIKFLSSSSSSSSFVVVSSSLDGSVIAHDLLKFKQFRSMTSPSNNPITCISLSSSSSSSSDCLVFAGTRDMPYSVVIFSLQTGHVIDSLFGHTDSISYISLSSFSTILSCSHDGSCKLWNVSKSSCLDTFNFPCEVISATPTASTSTAGLVAIRLANHSVVLLNCLSDEEQNESCVVNLPISNNSSDSTGLAWCACTDGSDCLLVACGNDVLMVHTSGQTMLKYHHSNPIIHLSTCNLPSIWCVSCVNVGICVYESCSDEIFAPINSNLLTTTDSIIHAIENKEYLDAIISSISLSDSGLAMRAIGCVPVEDVCGVVFAIPAYFLSNFIMYLGQYCASSQRFEFVTVWVRAISEKFGMEIRNHGGKYGAALRTLHQALLRVEDDISRGVDENYYLLCSIGTNLANH